MAAQTPRQRGTGSTGSHLNGTNYDSSQPWGENWADWSSASWGNGWAGTAGGVARQLGLKGRALGEFAKAVNHQKRRLAEAASGSDYGYDPSIEMPSWIRNLYESKGMNTGGITPTGKSGVGKYVNLNALAAGNSQQALGSLQIGGTQQAPVAAPTATTSAAGSAPYVPPREATAASLLNPESSRSATSNALSSLAIITGLNGSNTLNPLTGLQLA